MSCSWMSIEQRIIKLQMESVWLARNTVEMLLNSTSTQVLSAAKTPVHTLRTSLCPQHEILLHSQSSLKQPQTTRIVSDTLPLRVEKDNLCIHQINIPIGPKKARTKKNTLPPKTQRSRRQTKQKHDPFGLFLIPTYENFRPLLQSPPKRIQVERIVQTEKQTEESMRQAKKDEANANLSQSLLHRSYQTQCVRRACEQASILQRHLKKSRDTTFTYGFDGQMLLVTPRQCNGGFPRRTKVVVQPQEELRRENARESRLMRCARGEAFKSAVLQTTNLSRISVGEGDDVGRFMRSNQLFNNNHARQTSTAPYIRLNRGATYRELHRPETCFEIRPAKSKVDLGLQVRDQ